MDCKTARLLLELHRPWSPELGDDDLESLRSHVADCLECGSIQRAEQQADEAISSAMRAVPVPEGLRERILAQLANRRDRWYQRRILRWSMSAAAALLLLSIGWSWWHRPVAFDADAHAALVNDLPRDAAGVEKWFQDNHGQTVRAPRSFNYRLLTYCGRVELQGKLVPTMELTAPNRAVLRIYILDPAVFDQTNLGGQHSGGPFSIFTVAPSDTEPFGYLLEYSGGSIEPFGGGVPVG